MELLNEALKEEERGRGIPSCHCTIGKVDTGEALWGTSSGVNERESFLESRVKEETGRQS